MNEIIKRIQNGEKELLEKLVMDNIDYIYSSVKKYKDIFKEYEDLKQEAVKEFMQAVYSYKFNCDFLKTYARLRLFDRIRKYLFKHLDLITDEIEQYALCVKAYELCKKKVGHNPTIDDIKNYWRINDNVIYGILECLNEPNELKNKSLNEPEIDFEDKVLEKVYTEEKTKEILSSNLGKRQKAVLLFCYGYYNGKTYRFEEIARGIGGHKQSYSLANQTLIKKIKNKINE